MSLQASRKAIAMYFDLNWNSGIPFGADGQEFTVTTPSVLMTIKDSDLIQSSIGMVQNRYHRLGLLMFSIYTKGGTGSDEWRGIADALVDMTHAKCLDATGNIVTTGAQTTVVRFSPPEIGNGRNSYIANDKDGEPRQTTLVCPFVGYEVR